MKKQYEYNECALSVMQFLIRKLQGHHISLDELKLKSEINSKGISVLNMVKTLREYNIDLEAFKTKASSIFKNKNMYLVVTIKNEIGDHYVVIRVRSDYVTVNDPIRGKYILTFGEFSKLFTGTVLTVKVNSKNIIKKNEVKNNDLFFSLLGDYKIIVYMILSILLSIGFTISSSFFIKIVFDKVLPDMLNKLLNLVVIIFSTLAIMKSLNSFIRKYFMKKLLNKIEINIYKKYSNVLFNSNLKDIEKFSQTDVLRRLMMIEGVASFIGSSLFIVFQETLAIIIASTMLLWISPKLYIISTTLLLVSSLFSIVFYLLISNPYKDILKKSLISFGINNHISSSLTFQKNAIASKTNKQKLLNKFLDVKAGDYKIWKILSFQSLIKQIIGSIGPIVIVFISVKMIFNNELSIGSMMLFISVYSFYSLPFNNIVDFALKYRQNKENYRLVTTIVSLEREKINKTGLEIKKISNITISNLKFSYNEQVLNIAKYKIPKVLNIKGDNGSGKSTFAKVVSLRYPPSESVLFNGIESVFYNLESLREKILFISSSIHMSQGKLIEIVSLENKKMKQELILNIKKYKLEQMMIRNRLSLDTFVTENATNISSGQKQLIFLMTLISKKFDLIILDEAFENVSVDNLKLFQKIVKNYQKEATFIQISHSGRYLIDGEEVGIEKINSH